MEAPSQAEAPHLFRDAGSGELRHRPDPVTWLLHAFLLASGFSALVYQVAWVHILKVTFGTTVYAVSTVLSIFMAGLAIGSYAFGRWIDRVPHPLRTYAAVELATGLYAVLFVVAMPHLHVFSAGLLRGAQETHWHASLIKLSVAFIVLLPPATLMGATLPVLAKHVTESPRSIGMRLGSLYGINALGAVIGCLAVAFFLIPALGVSRSILLAGAINCALALAAALLSFRAGASGQAAAGPPPSEREPSTLPEPEGSIPGRRTVCAIAFASGFITLAAEVLWTRLFINLMTANVLIFAIILAAFLSGIAAGSLSVAQRLSHVRRPDVALGTILLLGAGCLLASVLGHPTLGAALGSVHRLNGTLSDGTSLFLLLATLFVVAAVPATVFGAVFPMLFRWCGRSLSTLGRDTGGLYACNTVGSIAGSLVSGFAMISLIGVNASLSLLAAGYAIAAWSICRSAKVRAPAAILAAACLIAVSIPAFRHPIYWMNFGLGGVMRVPPDRTLFLEEGIEGTVGVANFGGVLAMSINGVVIAESTIADLWDLLLKAHLPMMLHENPKRVALVGLGAGVSLGAVEAYDVEKIDCIEISSDVVPAHLLFGDWNGRCWMDPRLSLRIDDGRQFLLTTDERYDVISVDPADPPVVYQYTQEFIQVCHDRLNPGGLMVQWVPLFRLSSRHVQAIMKAFHNVFSETSLWYDGTSVLLVGRKGAPLEVDLPRFLERVREARVQESLARIGGPDAWTLLSTYVCGSGCVERLIPADVPENTDDLPFLEYAILLGGRLGRGDVAGNLEMLRGAYEVEGLPILLEDLPADDLAKLLEVRRLMRDLFQVRILSLRDQPARASELAREVVKAYGLSPARCELLKPFVM